MQFQRVQKNKVVKMTSGRINLADLKVKKFNK
jgi:hypothetical protein